MRGKESKPREDVRRAREQRDTYLPARQAQQVVRNKLEVGAHLLVDAVVIQHGRDAALSGPLEIAGKIEVLVVFVHREQLAGALLRGLCL